MEILPLANIELHGRNFSVTAKIGGTTPDAPYRGLTPSVVVLEAPEFEEEMGCEYFSATPTELAGLGKMASEHCYQMPVADYVPGTDKLSWYGESTLLWSLVSPEISSESVAFIATPSAVAYLEGKHRHI